MARGKHSTWNKRVRIITAIVCFNRAKYDNLGREGFKACLRGEWRKRRKKRSGVSHG